MKTRFLLVILLAVAATQTVRINAADACQPDGKVKFVCGLLNPEDLVSVPASDWVVASGMNGGGIHLINTHELSTIQAFGTADTSEKLDSRTYSTCPGPLSQPEKQKFSTHGINVRRGNNGVHTLYVVHHGARESIEVLKSTRREKHRR